MSHKRTSIAQWSAAAIEADITQCGLSGSPTRVKAVESIVLSAKESRVMGGSDEEIENLMVELFG
jgi:electron transfer flavoprotein beta subunit